MDDINEDWRDFLAALETCQVDYMIVGGVAVAAHGYPRYTKDLDVWYRATLDNATRLIEAIREFGFGSLSMTPNELTQPETIVQLGYEPRRIDLISSPSGVDFDGCFARRIRVRIAEVEVSMVSKPDLLVNKQASGRLQDLADIDALDETTTTLSRTTPSQ